MIRYIIRYAKRKRANYIGKHVLITGGSQGLGREFAKIFAKMGAKVSILSRNSISLNNIKFEIEDSPEINSKYNVFISHCDVRNEENLRDSIENCIKFNGPIDVLIPCAGSLMTK